MNTVGSLKNQQDDCHFENCHNGLASELRVEISICLSIGMALPKSG